jgi:hypothetical protein
MAADGMDHRMIKSPDEYELFDVREPDISTEPSGRLSSFVRRVVLAFLALIVILSMLSNLLALPEATKAPAQSDLGLTEDEIVTRYGLPDGRSSIQVFDDKDATGLSPRRLSEGERFFSLWFDEGPLTLVFHLVSPETYLKYNGYRIESDDWVVLERLIGTTSVVY